MPIEFLVLVFLFLASSLVTWFADAMNLMTLKDPARTKVPPELRDVYAEDRYANAIAYLKTRTSFGNLEQAVSLAALLAFTALGGFEWVDSIARIWFQSEITQGLCFAGILILLSRLTSLPLDLWDTFVIEKKFGFNKTTWSTYISDQIKGLFLLSLIGGVLFTLVVYFFDHFGEKAWLWAFLAFNSLQFLLVFIAPVVILPMFNKISPLPQGPLRDAIELMAKKLEFDNSGIFLMDGSRRSTKSNAFFTGLGKTKRIVLFDTLVSNHTIPEITAVLAHEIGHSKLKHIQKSLVLSLITSCVGFFVLGVAMKNEHLFNAFQMNTPSIYGTFILGGLLFQPVSKFFRLGFLYLSRKNEFEADRFAVEKGEDPKAMASALKKLSSHNLSYATPHPFKVVMEYTHPPVIERVRAITS